MNAVQSNRFFEPAPAKFSRTGLRLLMLAIIMLAFSGVIRAQNTKGDRPAAPSRETRFKTPFKKKKSAARSRSASDRRVKAPKRSLASRASGSAPRSASGRERPGKPVRPISAPRPQDKQKAWTGDIAGYRLRHKNRSSAGDGKTNVYPQYGRYTRVKDAKPRSTEHTVSNAGTLARLRKLESRPGPGPSKGPRVAPRSASGSFTARKSINVYANFAKPKRNTRQYNNTDLAGRPLRKKNSESPRPGVSEHRPSRFYHGRPSGERAYKGTSGGYISATRATPKAWTGDVAGRGLRRRNFTSKSTEGIPTLGSKPRSDSKGHPGSVPIMGRPPGIGASGIDAYHGNTKRVRPPTKLGGSVSGRVWNNNATPIVGRAPKQGGNAAVYRGRTRSQKPLPGGGSVSGRIWNNNATPIVGRAPKQGGDAALFRGRIKGGKPMTGGGSVSGRVWNNNGTPIVGRTPLQGWRASEFHGNVKTHRPGKGMPNVPNSMPRAGVSAKAKKIGGFPGDIKNYKGVRGYSFQGESHTGNIKLRRKAYVQHPDAAEASIKKHRPKNKDAEGLTAKQKQPGYKHNDNTVDAALMKIKPSEADLAAGGLHVRVREGKYGKKPHAAEGSMPGIKPTRNGQRAEELTARVKQPTYGTRPHAAEGSMPGIKPTKNSVKASEYSGSIKRNWDYIHNPSSAQEALRTREPGKAYARVSAYQGNIKMQKYALFEKNRNLHPDTKFIKTNKNNVDSERDALTNFKLWWARLFKKEETQPDNIKYKGRKPRYDKGEQGLWYE